MILIRLLALYQIVCKIGNNNQQSGNEMKILLDTNILIHREAATVIHEDIGSLFRIDYFLTEYKKIHSKALALNIQDRVFKIEIFLEKWVAKNSTLTDYDVLAIRRKHLGDIDIADPFFESFKSDYHWAIILSTTQMLGFSR